MSKDISIGSLKLKSPWIFAPMAGISDAVMRQLCEEQGAAMTSSEMISAKGLYYDGRKTESLTYIPEGSGPVSLQIFGSEPYIMAEAARRLDSLPNAVLDINMGCPVPKVVKNGEGSALMMRPERVYDIVKSVADASSKPVTAKIRKGFTQDNANAVEVARAIESAGGAAVAVHGRTRPEYYSGKVDRDIIRKVKEAVSIPVIASGDVTNAELGMSMMAETGCDMVMIGRGALGNPWIFRDIIDYMNTGSYRGKPAAQEVADMILLHARMNIALKGDYTGIREMRKHVAWYTAGMRGSSALRGRVNEIVDYASLEHLLAQWTAESAENDVCPE